MLVNSDTIANQGVDQFFQFFIKNYIFFFLKKIVEIVENHNVHVVYIPSNFYYQTSESKMWIRMPGFLVTHLQNT